MRAAGHPIPHTSHNEHKYTKAREDLLLEGLFDDMDDAEEELFTQHVKATKQAWTQGDKAKAQSIFQSYYVNEFNDLVPQFHTLGILGLAEAQYGIGMFLLDITTIEVPSKFESRLEEQSQSIQSILDQVPDKPLDKGEHPPASKIPVKPASE